MKKRLLCLLLALILLSTLSASALAAGTRTARADLTYRNIQIELDGQLIIPADETGAYVEPFIIGGTTYLPLRAVAGALGLTVGWDGDTGTITLTSGGRSTALAGRGQGSYLLRRDVVLTYRALTILMDGVPLVPKDANGIAVEPFLLGGTTYLPVRAISGALGLDVDWDGDSSTVILTSPEGQTRDTWLLTGVTASVSSGTGTAYTLRYTYDSAGNRVGYSYTSGDYSADTRYTYDSAGRLLTESTTGTEAGERFSASYRYTWDSKGLNTRIDMQRGSAAGVTQSTYALDGLIIRSTYTEQGTAAGKAYDLTVTTTYGYDEFGTLLAVSHKGETASGGVRVENDAYTYSYDESGRLYQRMYESESENSITTYAYRSDGQVQKLSFRRNRYIGEQQYTYSYEQSYAYGADGVCTGSTFTDSDGYRETVVYAYTEAGLLLRETATSSTGVTVTEYTYKKIVK